MSSRVLLSFKVMQQCCKYCGDLGKARMVCRHGLRRGTTCSAESCPVVLRVDVI